MFKVPAVCESCGLIFPSGIVVTSATNVTVRGNRCGPCPRCGSMGHSIDATFDFVGNVLRVVSATPEALDVLRRIQEAIKAANEAKTTEEAVRKTSEILPEAKDKIAATAGGGTAAIVGLLIALMTSCSNSVKIEGKVDFNRLFDQVTERSAPARLPGLGAPSSPGQAQPHQHTGPAKNPGQPTSRDGSTPKK